NLREFICQPDSKIYLDLELDLARHLDLESKNLLLLYPAEKMVVSFHFLHHTPTELKDWLHKLKATKVRGFIKLVTMVEKDEDKQIIADLYTDWVDDRGLLAFGMGEKGESTRIDCFVEWGGIG